MGLTSRAAFDLQQSLDGIRPASTGGQAVHGLRRQRNQLAFGQRLNGTVDHIASVVCITKIDNNRRHRREYMTARSGREATRRRRATGALPARRIINYIAGLGPRSRFRRLSPATQILGILKVFGVFPAMRAQVGFEFSAADYGRAQASKLGSSSPVETGRNAPSPRHSAAVAAAACASDSVPTAGSGARSAPATVSSRSRARSRSMSRTSCTSST